MVTYLAVMTTDTVILSLGGSEELRMRGENLLRQRE
jgi:hypothetical protein